MLYIYLIFWCVWIEHFTLIFSLVMTFTVNFCFDQVYLSNFKDCSKFEFDLDNYMFITWAYESFSHLVPIVFVNKAISMVLNFQAPMFMYFLFFFCYN